MATKTTSIAAKKTRAPAPAQDVDQPLKDELALVWHAINTSQGPLTIADLTQPDCPIAYANQAFYDLTGYGKDEVIGHNCRFLQGPDTDPATVTRLRQAIADRQDVRVQIYNYRKDGTPFWNDLIMSPVPNERGDVTHYIGLQIDDTARMEREEALRHSQHELARSNQELEQFAYIASHDLQEPLRMVVSYLGLLEQRYRDVLDERGHKYLDYATDGGRRMQALINDLLAFSRVKTKAQPSKPTDLNQVAEAVLFNLSVAIKEAGADISIAALPTIPADATQMTQLLQNLIGNALKYHQQGQPPRVNVTVTAGKDESVLSVQDNGIGIEAQYFDRIFNIFQRLHTKEEYPGTGIGLAMCRKIVERHGGRIWLDSTPGTGTTFHVALPTHSPQDTSTPT